MPYYGVDDDSSEERGYRTNKRKSGTRKGILQSIKFYNTITKLGLPGPDMPDITWILAQS